MARYTKKDLDGCYYIESVNGKLFSNIFGHTYGEAIDRFAELENAEVVPKSEVDKIIAEWAYLHADVLNKLENAKAEVACEIIGIIDKRIELKTEQCKGVHNEIVLGVYRGQLDAYRDIKEIIKQKYTEENEKT